MRHIRRLRAFATACMIGMTLVAGPPVPAAAGSALDARGAIYVVRPNDTLSGIAVSFHTTVARLLAANHLRNADRIVVGEVLVIPDRQLPQPPAVQPAPGSGSGAATAATTVYVVRPGDSLSVLAQRFNISLSRLAAANGLSPTAFLRIGQRLTVPAPGTVAVQTPTPLPLPLQTPTPLPTPAMADQTSIAAILTTQAQAAGLAPSLLKAVAWQESGWQMIVANDGGIGVMQLMPGTVDWIDAILLGRRIDPYNATDNVRAGAVLLRYYLDLLGDERLAVAAYHEGLHGVQTQGVSAEAAHYVANVMALQQRFGS